MELFEIATAAHLAGSIVLALFFFLLSRHESGAYLRDWLAAWVAQVLALSVLLVSLRPGWYASLSLYLFLETAHGLFLCSAARSYVRGAREGYRPYAALLVSLAAWSASAPFLFPEPPQLHAAQFSALAATYLGAAALLWPARGPAMGLRLTTNVLGLLGLLYLSYAASFGWAAHTDTLQPVFLDLSPFNVLFLQMLLGMGMVLTAMETAKRALAVSNAQLVEAERRLKVLAETDPLTGCFNRRVFREWVDALRARQHNEPGIVLMLDMDDLKLINDREGHAAGDEAIRRTAEAIRSRTRSMDWVVRWGGDEFVVVLPGASLADAITRRDQIDTSIRLAGFVASVGLAAYGPERDIMGAIEEADRAMYQAKASRKQPGNESPDASEPNR